MLRTIFGEQFWARRTSFIEKFAAKKRAFTIRRSFFNVANRTEPSRAHNKTDYGERVRAIKSQQAQLNRWRV